MEGRVGNPFDTNTSIFLPAAKSMTCASSWWLLCAASVLGTWGLATSILLKVRSSSARCSSFSKPSSQLLAMVAWTSQRAFLLCSERGTPFPSKDCLGTAAFDLEGAKVYPEECMNAIERSRGDALAIEGVKDGDPAYWRYSIGFFVGHLSLKAQG